MIAYFSGTGNSRYLALALSKLLDEPVTEISRTDPVSMTFSGQSLGLVMPVYAWGIPPLVTAWIKHWSERFVEEIRARGIFVWAVLTCGDETGMAPEMLNDALRGRGLKASALWSVMAPNVYVLLPGFNVDSAEVEQRKLSEMKERLSAIADAVRSRRKVIDLTYGSFPRLKTRLVYPLFRRWGIRPSKWRWTPECIGCGQCVKACPMDNIVMKGGHPKWGADCVSCLGCYHVCPTHAVQYGSATQGKGQYYLRRPREDRSSLSSERKD